MITKEQIPDWKAFQEDRFHTLQKAYQHGLPLSGNVKYLYGYELGSITVGDVRYDLTANTIDFKSKITPENGFIYLAPRVGMVPKEIAAVGKKLTLEEKEKSYRTAPGMGLIVTDEALESLESFQNKINRLANDHIQKNHLEKQAQRNTGFWQKYEKTTKKTFQR